MKPTASLKKENNTLRVEGEMNFDTVMRLLKESKKLFSCKDVSVVDFSQVTHADSAGLALLCEWRRNYPVLQFQNFPERFQRLIKVSGLESALVF